MLSPRPRSPRILRRPARAASAASAFLVALGLWAAGAEEGAPGRASGPRAEPPPSLLVVTLDTTRADHVGAYGRDPSPTPHLDALASAGVRFENALSPTPLTLPSHATLFTAEPPRVHGARVNAPDVLAERWATLAEKLNDAGWSTAAVVGSAVLDRRTGIDQGFGAYDDQVRVGNRAWFDWRERAASHVAAASRAVLDELAPPFFLWVHFFDPHLPYVPPERWAERFPGDPYTGEIAFADEQLGVVLEAARERAKGRLVVLAAGDHGESLGEHGEKDHGVFVYQATQRVPLVLAGAGLPEGRVVRQRVGLVDVAPTLLALLGGPSLDGVTGRDLSPLWTEGSAEPRDYELESLHGYRAYGWSPLAALVRGRHKLVLAPTVELYDLVADPRERRNLARERPEVAETLRAALLERIAGDAELLAARTASGAFDEDRPDGERMARLRSLGYAGGSAARPGETLPDPKNAIAWLADLDRARRLVREAGERPGAAREAVDLLEGLLAKNPANQPARLSLGSALLATGATERAIAVFREAVARNPVDYLTHFNLATGLEARRPRSEETLREALRAYEAALDRHPRHADAHAARARLLAELRGPGEALAALDEARRRGVQDANLATMRGAFLARAGRAEDARAALDAALALSPRHAPALEARARLAYARGRLDAAVADYRRALDVAPRADLARTLGSILLLRLDRPGEARAAYELALELEPRGPEAARVRSILREIDRTPPPAKPTPSGEAERRAFSSEGKAGRDPARALRESLPARFAGVLPCATCAELRVRLDLLENGVYLLREERVGPGSESVAFDFGRWKLTQGEAVLALPGGRGAPRLWRVVDSVTLRKLDAERRPAGSGLTYALQRAAGLEPVEPALAFRGEYRYLADAALFEECRTGWRLPVSMEKGSAHASLERAYLDARSEPGAPVLVEVEGRIAPRPPMEGEGSVWSLVVDRVVDVRPGASCDAPR